MYHYIENFETTILYFARKNLKVVKICCIFIDYLIDCFAHSAWHFNIPSYRNVLKIMFYLIFSIYYDMYIILNILKIKFYAITHLKKKYFKNDQVY